MWVLIPWEVTMALLVFFLCNLEHKVQKVFHCQRFDSWAALEQSSNGSMIVDTLFQHLFWGDLSLYWWFSHMVYWRQWFHRLADTPFMNDAGSEWQTRCIQAGRPVKCTSARKKKSYLADSPRVSTPSPLRPLKTVSPVDSVSTVRRA